MSEVLSQQELEAMHAYWRAANYLSVGQIYLFPPGSRILCRTTTTWPPTAVSWRN
jgi:hypothetical protein